MPQAEDRGFLDLKLFDQETETKIHSGDEINLTTSDPVRLPLPDKCILEMQWFLQHVAASKGAAEVFDDDYSDYEDWQEVVLQSPDVEAESTPSSPSLDSTPPSSASKAEVKSIHSL
jgi:hypothetical protein